ncbi:hypothetical protein UCRPA7_1885 [Phaeoacremonium minimum UCRPA7]|uniref:Pantothenate transporter liz1 n=1 Tax=Phaeoacremonium minimum (strain UCR-PA7) TaxID=1286976 RepID=R8BTA4_PHAM7|nr:hypothetical protein UCRPA7_1885 [Phaeoacremonium minimum UCRPA7]EOO02612.1 hypothetical protein UCRPA7_1885 [Phaeoacremonium minimum UCRPA7]
MSPIVARAAIRAAGRRQFSVMRSMRNFARSFEAHPFERMPVTSNSQAADWGKQFKRVGSQALIYVPGFALILGWPAIFKTVLDGHMGQY